MSLSIGGKENLLPWWMMATCCVIAVLYMYISISTSQNSACLQTASMRRQNATLWPKVNKMGVGKHAGNISHAWLSICF